MSKEVEQYYFKTGGWNHQDCTEPCEILNNGVMIGSVTCQNCENCIEVAPTIHEYDPPNWIKCKLIKPSL